MNRGELTAGKVDRLLAMRARGVSLIDAARRLRIAAARAQALYSQLDGLVADAADAAGSQAIAGQDSPPW